MVDATNLPTNNTTSSTGHVTQTNLVNAAVNQVTAALAATDPASRAPLNGSLFYVGKNDAGLWPASWDTAGRPVYTGGAADSGVRPTASADVHCIWVGADPSPAIVTSGTAGMRQGVDVRWRSV